MPRKGHPTAAAIDKNIFQGEGVTKAKGTSYNFDNFCSGSNDGRFGKLSLIRDADILSET